MKSIEPRTKSTKKKNTSANKILNILLVLTLAAVVFSGVLLGIAAYRYDREVDLSHAYSNRMLMRSDALDVERSRMAVPYAARLCVAGPNVSCGEIAVGEAEMACLMNLDTRTVIYAKNMYDRAYPASITKIMTAMLALEYGNMEDSVTITDGDLALEEGSQMSGMKAGDTVTMNQLFHTLMIYSANDAAMAIARQVGGSVEQFVEMMNRKAADLGMTGTHFVNPHGLHDENHYTTAYDIYLMLQEALQYTEFTETMRMGSYTLNITASDGSTYPLYLTSTDKYLTGEASAPSNVTVLGGKTGTTSEAGACLAIMSQNSYGQPFISVILNARTKSILYEDMNLLLSQINS